VLSGRDLCEEPITHPGSPTDCDREKSEGRSMPNRSVQPREKNGRA